MRLSVKTFVSAVVIAGSLASTGIAAAAPVARPASHPVVSVNATMPSRVVNLGLSRDQAKKVQGGFLIYFGYTGSIDGLLGANSWKAFQRSLQGFGYTGQIDGIVGRGTIMALQRLLQSYGYTGAIDGIAGSGTKAAFGRFADSA